MDFQLPFFLEKKVKIGLANGRGGDLLSKGIEDYFRRSPGDKSADLPLRDRKDSSFSFFRKSVVGCTETEGACLDSSLLSNKISFLIGRVCRLGKTPEYLDTVEAIGGQGRI